jgi:LysM repeat protein
MKKLQTLQRDRYVVKRGQTAAAIAEYFQIPVTLLIKANGLTEEPYEGQMLKIPLSRGNLYVAQAGDGKQLLCGSKENYEARNGTPILHAGMKIFL